LAEHDVRNCSIGIRQEHGTLGLFFGGQPWETFAEDYVAIRVPPARHK
jgi:hypothetical protein